VATVGGSGPLYFSGLRIFPLLAILANIAILSLPSCLNHVAAFCLGVARRCRCLGEALLSTPVCCGRRLCVLSVAFVVTGLCGCCCCCVVKPVDTLEAPSCVVAVMLSSMMFRRSECSFCSSVREFSLF
jgi:hypothetical protein